MSTNFSQRLPVIVSFGGVGAAGRSSSHQAYRRTTHSALPTAKVDAMWRSLAGLTGSKNADSLDQAAIERLRTGSLVRRIEPSFFNPNAAPWNRRVCLQATDTPLRFEISKRELPEAMPPGWTVESTKGEGNKQRITITVTDQTELFVPDTRDLGVAAGGMVPTGFEPGDHYPARSHPRGLELTVVAASDAINSLGIDWQTILDRVPPDQFSTYAGSAMTQLDQNGNGGLLSSRQRGKRVSSKQVPMGLGEMAADFTNAYVLGSMGQTGHNMGACATFHYNLRLGVQDIREGRSRVAVIGGVEAPLVADAMDGLATMGALIGDAALLQLEGKQPGETPNHRRACRPFGINGGFVMGEGAQFCVLMDAELAVEMGANILGAVGDVFVHADGHKKSISSPGVGNYITFAKAVASARKVLGTEAIAQRSFVHAHGTGTPQNRTSESEILDLVAKTFDIQEWPVAAIKCFVGHTMAAAGGDQLASCLGTWADGVIPGIATIDGPADDISGDRLRIDSEHITGAATDYDVAFLNAKGFGGNNATAWVAGPHVVQQQLEQTFGGDAMSAWRDRVEITRAKAAEYDAAASKGDLGVTYKFDHDVRQGEHVTMTVDELLIEGHGPIAL